MPTLLSAQFFVLTGILVCVVLLTIAFHLQGRAVQQAQSTLIPLTPPDISTFALQSSSRQKAAWHPSLVVVPLLLIIVFGRWFTRTTYYDYFVYATLFWPLFAIFISALFLASLTSGALITTITHWWKRLLLRLMLLGLAIAFGWAAMMLLPSVLIHYIQALRSGPQLATGQIERKDSIGGSSPVASIVVDGRRYQTFDFGWWGSLHPNQTLHFIHDPAHTTAFEPTHINLTPIGGVVSICIGAVWLWVGGFGSVAFPTQYRGMAQTIETPGQMKIMATFTTHNSGCGPTSH